MEQQVERLPWMKFRTRDWLDSKELRRCSAAARGLLADLMALAHEGTPYGHLHDTMGPLPEDYLSSRCNFSRKEFSRLLAELVSKRRVLDESGVLVIPQMVKDEDKRQKKILDGKKGGNPNVLVNHTLTTNNKVGLPDGSSAPRARTSLSLSSGSGVLSGKDFSEIWKSAGFDSYEAFEEWFLWMKKLHPPTRLGAIQIAKDGLRDAFLAGKTTRATVERAYAHLQRSKDWREGIVQSLTTMVVNSFWECAPPESVEQIDTVTAERVGRLAKAIADGQEREFWIGEGCTPEDADQMCAAKGAAV